MTNFLRQLNYKIVNSTKVITNFGFDAVKNENWTKMVNWFECFFCFLLPISRESIVFGSKFRNGDFDGFTRYEDPWIRKSYF